MKSLTFLFALATMPTVAHAQSYSCSVPRSIASVHPELPSVSEPARRLPIGGYTLAISWAPGFCRDRADSLSARFQCNSGNRFGFTLHGLWPDGRGKIWPQYCVPAKILTPTLIRRNLCATPSAQLLQHEWAKHGTCMPGYSPAQYFARSTALYGRLRYPDMDALSRNSALTAGDVATAIAAANPRIRADMMRVTADRQGWLEEVWLCLDKRFRYQTCPAHQGGLAAASPIKIWRGPR